MSDLRAGSGCDRALKRLSVESGISFRGGVDDLVSESFVRSVTPAKGDGGPICCQKKGRNSYYNQSKSDVRCCIWLRKRVGNGAIGTRALNVRF
jgi:hypothetical protein